MNRKTQQKITLVIGVLLLVTLTLAVSLTTLASAQTHTQPNASNPAFVVDVFTVGNGSVTKQPDQATYTAGTVITLTAVANTGWRFSGWSGDINGTLSPAQLTVSSNHEITATFTQRCYTLSLSHSGDGDDPVATPANSVGCSLGKYVYNQAITLNALPDSGWQIASWSGTNNNGSTSSSNTVTMPADNHAASVAYTQICYPLIINVTPNDGGQVAASPQENCNNDKYTAGTTVQLTATPAEGFIFQGWGGALTGDTNPTTININSSTSVTAAFAEACYALILTHSGQGSDPTAAPTQSPGCNAGEYVADANVVLTAVPANNWQVKNWEGTNADNSTATSNSVTMPGEDHVARVNYIERPNLYFSAASFSVNEDNGTAAIKILRSGSTAEVVEVDIVSSNGTAVEPDDYTAVNQTLTFGANVVTRTLNIPIINDNTAEGTQAFNLTLVNPSSNAQLGMPQNAVVTILDDEGDPTVQFSSTTFSVDESGATIPITVTIFPASTQHVYVDFDTQADTATSGVDFMESEQILHFMPGQTILNANVSLIDDLLDEPNETISLTLSGIFNAELGESDAVLTIMDNDAPPSVSFNKQAYFAFSNEDFAAISVTLNTPSGLPVAVVYEVTDVAQGTQHFAGTLNFAASESEQIISVPITGQPIGQEFLLVLRTPSNAILGTPSVSRLFILDENRSDCYTLTMTHTGGGSDPVATNTPNSIGCDPGQYIKGELISVAVTPQPGWNIAGWSGTLNNVTDADTNVVLMPENDHTVSIAYITSTFLPNLLHNHVDYFFGPNETEPNNGFATANGPIRSGTTYFGNFSLTTDQDDLFYFILPENGNIQVELTKIPGGRNYDLYLYKTVPNVTLVGYSAAFSNSNESISGSFTAGKYFVVVRRISGEPSSTTYNLQTTYD